MDPGVWRHGHWIEITERLGRFEAFAAERAADRFARAKGGRT
jgi:hypothetical protein